MKTHIKNLLLLLLLLGLPGVVQAQDAYSTNADGNANIVAYAGPPWVVTIPTNINGLTVTTIGTNAFYDYTSLTSVTIPDSVTSIGYSTFASCTSLTSVTILYGITNIGDNAFQECTSLTNITIPKSVTSLTSVTIPDSVTNIGGTAFSGSTNLTAITVDTNNPAYSSLNGVLFDKSQTTLIQYPEGLVGGSYMIPSSVTSIGEDAFFDCTSLTNVTIPTSVTSIGLAAFWDCTSLTSVYFTGNAPSAKGIFLDDPATVYYLPGTTGWGGVFDGLPTAPWFLPNPQILTHSASFGVQPGGFGFTISWATNASVVVEAATNLANPVWIPVSTSPLTSGTSYFNDPQWTNYPGRFYRVQLSS